LSSTGIRSNVGWYSGFYGIFLGWYSGFYGIFLGWYSGFYGIFLSPFRFIVIKIL
jgi:hypothetical protein